MSAHQTDAPSLAALLRAAAGEALAKVHTSIPAVVVSYDPVTQRAVVQPTISGKYRDPDTEAVINVELPKIARVPVAFPGTGDYSIVWPLAAGDAVTLVFAERSIDEWLQTGNTSNEPADPRRFDLSDAIAIPGGRSFADPVPSAGIDGTAMVIRAPEIRLGSRSASDFVALASLVDARLSAIKTAYDLHTHIGVTAGPGVTGTPSTGLPSSATVAASKVKAE